MANFARKSGEKCSVIFFSKMSDAHFPDQMLIWIQWSVIFEKNCHFSPKIGQFRAKNLQKNVLSFFSPDFRAKLADFRTKMADCFKNDRPLAQCQVLTWEICFCWSDILKRKMTEKCIQIFDIKFCRKHHLNYFNGLTLFISFLCHL